MRCGRILGGLLAVTLVGAAAGCAGPVSFAPGSAATRTGGCASDRRLLLGACVTTSVAERACGATARSTLDGCVGRAPCEAGRARDLASGECLTRRDVRELAASAGVLAEDDTLLTCPGGGELAVARTSDAAESERLGCLAAVAAVRGRACAVGTVDDGLACRAIVLAGARIDVTTWLRAAIGPEGGTASPALCRALGLSPGVLALAATVDIELRVDLVFPDNDVTQVVAQVAGSGASTAELDRVVEPLVEALRALGGTANQASIGTAVHCRRSSERPVSVPVDETGQIR